jgi:hypothetical protein
MCQTNEIELNHFLASKTNRSTASGRARTSRQLLLASIRYIPEISWDVMSIGTHHIVFRLILICVDISEKLL